MTAAATSASPSPSPSVAYRGGYLIAFVCGMAAFMEVLDTSIANVALVHIAGSLSASRDEATWVLTSYLVSNAIILPMTGWLSDRLGRKRYYLASMVLFTLASVACGLSTSLPMLIICRVLQGLAGGALQPVSQAILADSFPPEKRSTALAVYGVSVIAAPAIGPAFGGYITEHFSWHWIFLINAPVGVLLVLLAGAVIRDTPAQRERQKEAATRHGVDYIGFALIALCMASLQVMFDKGQQEDWLASNFIRGCILICITSGVLLVRRELRAEHPIINLRLLGQRNFLLANLMLGAQGITLFGSILLMPQFMQTLLGYSALDAGIVLSPAALVTIAMMPIVVRLSARVDPRLLISIGFLSITVAMLAMTHINLELTRGDMIWLRVTQMIGIGFIFIPINALAYYGIPSSQTGSATAIVNLTRNIGGGIGISLVTTYLARSLQTEQAHLVDRVSLLDPAYEATMRTLAPALGSDASAHALIAGQVARQAGLLAYIDAYQLLALFAAVMIPLVWFARRPKPGAAVPTSVH